MDFWIFSIASSSKSFSSVAMVKVKSVLPSIPTFWTITSTFISDSLSGPSIFDAIPGVSSTAVKVTFVWSFWKAIPEISAFSIDSFSKVIIVPVPGEKLDRTLTGTLNLFANSTALIWMTLAPCPASSSIPSIEIASNFLALGTILGSVVYIPSTSV